MLHARARRLGLIALLLAVLAACASPPQQLAGDIEGIPARIDSVQAEVNQARAGFDRKLSEPRFAFIAGYTPSEQKRDRFVTVEAKLAGARQAFANEVTPINDGYSDDQLPALQQAVDKVNGLLREAQALAAEPSQWADQLAGAEQDSRRQLRRAEADAAAITADLAAVNAEAASAKMQYPAKAAALDERFAPLVRSQQQAAASFASARTEQAKPQPNWAIFLTEISRLIEAKERYAQQSQEFRTNSVMALGQSETQTLLDMRADYVLTVERTSWNEGYDYPTETEFEYPPVTLTPETAAFFSQKNPGDLLGSYYGSWFGSAPTVNVDGDRGPWDSLKLDPVASFPRSDNAAEYYLGEFEGSYCQLIHVVRNGRPVTSGPPENDYCSQYNTPALLAEGNYWVEVDAEEFREHQGDLGMDIYSKQAGLFADEAAEVATPPGMSYVGNPQYGQWRGDTWEFFPQYLFFAGLINGPGYDRGYYNDWRRYYPREAYYGPRDREREYGTSSVFVVSSGRFDRTYYKSSGLETRAASIRGAGPAARGGGPGGGGK